jgi:hypothetical protein
MIFEATSPLNMLLVTKPRVVWSPALACGVRVTMFAAQSGHRSGNWPEAIASRRVVAQQSLMHNQQQSTRTLTLWRPSTHGPTHRQYPCPHPAPRPKSCTSSSMHTEQVPLATRSTMHEGSSGHSLVITARRSPFPGLRRGRPCETTSLRGRQAHHVRSSADLPIVPVPQKAQSPGAPPTHRAERRDSASVNDIL